MFKALLAEKNEEEINVEIRELSDEDLPEGDVLIDVEFSTINYKDAEDRGYFKLDFLNVSIYKDIKDESHLQTLMERKPIWELLEHDDFNEKVFHLNGHGELLRQLKPTSVEQLAATLAIIRPAKRHLATEQWSHIMEHVWTKPTDGEYYFKKAHAVAYAVGVVVHMNLLCEQIDELRV